MIAALLLSVLPTLGGGSVHPSDGPDADVRVLIREDRVQVSVGLNLAFVDEILDVPREDANTLYEVEAEALRAELVDYLARENTVEIDGVRVAPVDAGFAVTQAPENLIPLFPRFGARALIKVALDLEYSALSPPREVRLVWGPFPPDAVLSTPSETPPVQITAQLSAEGETSLVTFTADEPEYRWRGSGVRTAERFLPVPAAEGGTAREVPAVSALLGLVALAVLVAALRPGASAGLRRAAPLTVLAALAGAALARDYARIPLPGGPSGLPDDAQAREIFRPLHANIYRAFDYEDESDVYDALARSVDGELLDELYGEVYRGLILQEAGGAVSRIQAVHLLEAEVSAIERRPPADRPGFDVEALWQVEGAVYHWGHAHSRTNEYRASYTVLDTGEGWRIAANQVLSERRVDAAPLGEAPPDGFPEAGEMPALEPNPLPDLLPPDLEDI
ncbi:MAG: hypothetical protein AAF682_28860 [Planctomycetota bacterium]